MQQKKAQVTIFIIIAIVILAAALFSYFVIFRAPSEIPVEVQPVESYFLDCSSEKAKEAVALAGMQGGYLELPPFEQGSEYKQFSNYYSFLGTPIPYWYYVSGNNIQKEQVPSKEKIEGQLSRYLKDRINECTLESFIQQGYDIEAKPTSSVSVLIKDSSIEITINKEIRLSKGDIRATITNHKTSFSSNFGALYKEAKEIYDYEQENMFLENYALDTLYLNAPVTGVEITCAPKIWAKEQVKEDLKGAISANIGQVKIKGSYYRLASQTHRYFEVDIGKSMDDNVNFLVTEPYRIEIWPSENELLRADPVGNQAGLSLMGFCYVPYHFVYDIDFPVLVQIARGDEIFQFPVAVVIDKTVPREAELGETGELGVEICDYKGAVGTVYTYDNDNVPVEAEVSFKCFNQVCPIGETKLSGGTYSVTGFFPQCLNGFVLARKEGYSQAKAQVSSNMPFTSSVYLQKLKRLNVNMNLGAGESAIITFSSDEHGATLIYPQQKEVELTSAVYEVSAQVLKERTMTLPAETTEKCVSVKDWLGMSHEQCYELELPAQKLTNVVFGGGVATFAPSMSEINSASNININVPRFDVPSNVLELQDIYSLIAVSEVQLSLS